MTPVAQLAILVSASTGGAAASLTKLDSKLKGTAAASTASSSKVSRAASLMGKALVAGAAYGLFKAAQAGIAFEKQMDSLGAVVDGSTKQMERLEAQALRLGQSSVFSASETAQAQIELAKGGLKTADILGGALPSALNLAAAGELELAEAASTTVNAMKLFDIEGKKSSQVADMLATAANTTTADVADFAMALRQGGAAAKVAGLDLNDTITILEALAEAGVKNSDAGTSMKTALIQLIKPTEKQADLAEALGISWVNQSGAMKDGVAISKELRAATDGMTQSERAKTFAVLAGTDGFRTLSALYDAGPEKLRKLGDANAELGTAQEIATKKMDNTAGSIEQLKGALETLGIKLFQSAQSPFRDFIDGATGAIQDFTDVISDKKLTSGEKFAKILDMLQDAMVKAVPKIAEAAGKLGIALARGLAEGFMNAPILGKLFMGGMLLRALGGAGGAGGLGKTLGTRFGTGFGNAAGPIAVGLIMSALEGIKFGKSGALSQERSSAGFLAEELDITLKKAERLMHFMEAHPGLGAPEALAAMSRARRQHLEPLQLGFGTLGFASEISAEDLRKWASRAIGSFDETRRKALPQLRDLAVGADRHTKQAAEAMGANVKRGSQTVLGELIRAQRGGKKSTSDLASGVALNIFRLASAVGQGMLNIQQNTKGSLADFGVKFAGYAIKKVGNLLGLQSGGVIHAAKGAIVPGSGSGDTVPLHIGGRLAAMVEPREYVSVANRTATAALMQHNANVQRLAVGGVAQPPGDPGSEVVQAAYATAVGKFLSTYDMDLTQGYNPSGPSVSAGHLSLSAPPSLDVIPLGGDWDGRFAQGLKWALSQGMQVGYDGQYGTQSWAGHGEGNHAHIDWLGSAVGAMGAAIQKIAKVLLKGPAGPLKDMGQGALDKVWKGANKFIASKAGSMGGADVGSFGSSGLYDLGELAKLWTTVNDGLGDASTMARIALAESSGDPGAIGNDPGGTTGLGLWQITTGFNDDVIAQFGGRNAMFIPSKNAAAAGAIFSRQGLGAWGASSANWQQGGIVQKLAEGGTVGGGGSGFDIGAALHSPEALQGLLGQITGVGLPPEIVAELAALAEQSDRAEEFASRASDLTIESITENGEPIWGQVEGLNEVQWLGQALEKMFVYRNRLISAHGGQGTRFDDMVTLLQRAKDRLAEVKDAIRKAVREHGEAQQKLEEARKHGGELEGKLSDARDTLQEELGYTGRRRNPGRIEAARDEIDRLKHRLGLNAEHRESLRDQMAQWDDRRNRGEKAEGVLDETLIPAIEDQSTLLSDSRVDLLSSLMDVQGSGPMGLLDVLPDVGVLGGRIFDTQMQIRDYNEREAERLAALNLPPETAESFDSITDSPSVDDGSSELAGLLSEQLKVANQTIALMRAQMPVLSDPSLSTYMGAFAKGGVALVGETGPELAHMPSGTRIHSAADTQSMLGGQNVNVSVAIFEGEDRARVSVNDRDFEVAIERLTRRAATNRKFSGYAGQL